MTGWKTGLWSLGFILIGLFIYGPSLRGSFQFDDYSFILGNASIRDLSAWRALLDHPVYQIRFVSFLTFAWNYHLHQYDVLGYHLVNTGIHILNALCVWWMISLIFKTPVGSKQDIASRKWVFGLGAALLFLVHPVQTQAVSYLSQRFTSLSTFFYLLSVVLFLYARLKGRILCWIGCGGCMILALFSKQIAFTLPIMLFMIDFFFFPFSKNRWRWVMYGLGGLFLGLLPFMYHFDVGRLFLVNAPSGSHAGDVVTAWAYALTQWKVIFKYLQLLIFPVGLNLDYDFALVRQIDLYWMVCFLTVGTLLVYGFHLFEKHRLMSFGICWFFLTLSVESSILPIRHVIFEHRVYLPSIGFFILGMSFLLTYGKDHNRIQWICFVIISLLAWGTYQRNFIWKSEVALWSDVVKKSPRKPRGYINLGKAYASEEKWAQSLDSLSKALEMDPQSGLALTNRGYVLLKTGQLDQAGRDLTQAIALKPSLAEAYFNRGLVFAEEKDWISAELDLTQAIQKKAAFAKAYFRRGVVRIKQQKKDQALDDFSQAIRLYPHYAAAYNNRGNIYKEQGWYEQALADYTRAIDVQPGYQTAYFNRASVYRKLGKEALYKADLTMYHQLQTR